MNTGVLYSLPTITSSMASPMLADQAKGRAQTKAMVELQTREALSGRALQALLEKEGHNSKPPKTMEKKHKPNINAGGGADGRT